MKHLIGLILFFSVTNAFAAAAAGNSHLRFVCQKYSAIEGIPQNRVAIVEQLSTKRINWNWDEVIDGSDLIDPQGGGTYTGQTEFRMRFDASLVSDNKTKRGNH